MNEPNDSWEARLVDFLECRASADYLEIIDGLSIERGSEDEAVFQVTWRQFKDSGRVLLDKHPDPTKRKWVLV